MSTATWSPVPRNSRLRLPATTRTTRHCWRRRTAQYQGMSQTATAAVLGLCRIRHEDPDAKARRHPQPILTDCCFPRSVPPEPIPLKVSFDVPGVGGRPPHPLSRPFGSASVSWVGAPLLPAGPNEGGVAAVFRGPGVQATTMPDGNDRERDGHHRQRHGFGGEDAPARRAHVEIVLTPVWDVKPARNVPTVPRQIGPGRCLQAWCCRGSNANHGPINVRPRAWSRLPGQCWAKAGLSWSAGW